MKKRKEIVRQVSDIYKWLDEQLRQKPAAGICAVCGKCCDFESFGHRLFVTTPEIIYFVEKVGSADIKQMTSARCPYQLDDKCTVYQHRFAGCRIFFCKGDAAFQSDLTETVVKKFKTICDEFNIPYQYVDLPTALNNFSR
jgi:Fe-S-cluster containining protein